MKTEEQINQEIQRCIEERDKPINREYLCSQYWQAKVHALRWVIDSPKTT